MKIIHFLLVVIGVLVISQVTSAQDLDSFKPAVDENDEAVKKAPYIPEQRKELRPVLLGAGAGLAVPFNEMDPTFFFEVEVGGRFLFDGRFGASLTLGYTRPTSSGSVTYRTDVLTEGEGGFATESYETAMDQLVLGLHVFYRFLDDSSWWTPWVAFGPGFFFLSHTVEAFDSSNTETDSAVGIIGSVGVDFLAGPGAITVMMRFPWAPLDNKTIGDSNLGKFIIQVGYRFFF